MLALLSLVRRMISGTVAPSARSVLTFSITGAVRIGLGPNLTPAALALLIPSCWRSRRMSFSNSAIRARMPMTSFPVRELVSIEGSSSTLKLTLLVLSSDTIR